MVMIKKIFLDISILTLTLFIGVLVFSSFSQAELGKSKKEKLSEVNREIEQLRLEEASTEGTIGEDYSYSYSKDKDKRELLKNTMDRVKAAKKEMSEILKGDIKIYESWKGGAYFAKVELAEENSKYFMAFRSAEGGLKMFEKEVSLDKEKPEDSSKKKYVMRFYGNGNIQDYRGLDPKEGVGFDQNGKLTHYYIYLKNGNCYELELNEDGTIKHERVRSKDFGKVIGPVEKNR